MRPRCGPGRRECRRLRSISRASGTGSGVVQSPSMNDSPMPMSLPVSAAGRTDRRARQGRVEDSSAHRIDTCGRGHFRVSVPPRKPAEARQKRRLRPPRHHAHRSITESGSIDRSLSHSRAFSHPVARHATHEGHALPPQFQRLPVNAHHDVRGHGGVAEQPRRISSALQGRRSSDSVASKQTEPALTVSMCATRCRRWREGELVIQVDRHERRDVERLGDRRRNMRGRRLRPQPVVVRPAKGVADFREDHPQPLGGIEAVEEGHGVEAVAEIPQVRQQRRCGRPAGRSRDASRRARACPGAGAWDRRGDRGRRSSPSSTGCSSSAATRASVRAGDRRRAAP